MQKTAQNAQQSRTTRLVPAGNEAFARAAEVLRAGGLVAFPTETVYGLGAAAFDGGAVADLYAAKGRPAFNPLIVHVPNLHAAENLATFNAPARALAEAFWPGPLTLVLPARKGSRVASLATAGLDSVALRVPAHPAAQGILAAFGEPIVAPSANLSGHVSPTQGRHVLADLDGRIDLIVDDGPCAVGVESTIVSCLDHPAVLRPGGIARADIERVLGAALLVPLAAKDHAAHGESLRPQAPGMLEQHYAPHARVRLNADRVAPGEALLAFGSNLPPGAEEVRAMRNLSPHGDLREAAMQLFDHLRALDRPDVSCIAVMPIPNEGLGEAINDRLARAAAPRIGESVESGP